MSFNLVDGAIIAAYLIVVLAIAIVAARRATSGEELFLAGRSLGFIAIGLSLFASNISSTTLIGVMGAAYGSGISVAHYELMAAVILVIMAAVSIPLFLRNRLTTIPEYLERRFGPSIRRYVSALTLFLSVFVDTAGSVYAGVLVVQTFVPSVPFVPACVAFALFAGFYTAVGGLRAVVYTDVLQAIVLLLGAGVITWEVFAQFDFSWSRAVASIDADKLSLVRPLDDPGLPWLGVLIGLPVLGFYYWATNQYIMQRVLGARSLDHARWGAMLAALLKIAPLFLIALPGAFAFSLLPPLDRPDQVFATLIREYLPVGLSGLVLAGLVAAIMSTIDSTLNSASTLLIHDFLRADEKKWAPRKVVFYGRLATAGFMLVAAFWPLAIREFPGLFDYIQQVFSYAVPPMVAVFLLAFFWRRMNGRAALATLIFGHVLGAGLLFWRMWAQSHGVDDGLPHFTIVAGLTTLLCLFVAVLVTLAMPASAAAARQPATAAASLWQVSDFGTPRRGWLDYRWQGAVVLAVVAVIVWAFR